MPEFFGKERTMKLYIMYSGGLAIPNEDPCAIGADELLKAVIPVPVYLIEHSERGYILVDTGIEPGLLADFMKVGMWYKEEWRIDNQLKQIGLTPKDISYLFISHLHMDHFCQIPWFRDSTMIVREKEWEAARQDGSPGYMPMESDIVRSFSDIKKILVPDVEEYDIFGDGTLVSVDTKGHTPGHQSLLVNLEKEGPKFLTFDACNIREFLESDRYFGRHSADLAQCHEAVQKIKAYQDKGAEIIFGHDAYQFAKLRKFPEFYE